MFNIFLVTYLCIHKTSFEHWGKFFMNATVVSYLFMYSLVTFFFNKKYD